MFEYEQETYGSKGRERIRAAGDGPHGKEGEGPSSSDAPPEG